MAKFEKSLVIKKSTIQGAGKGLFTKTFIPKGAYIIEYTGEIKTGKDVKLVHWENRYIVHVNRNHLIDASKDRKLLARYVNDARGLVKDKNLNNNGIFINDNGRIFIHSKRDIQPGSEIFVGYGKQYWDIIKYNETIAI